MTEAYDVLIDPQRRREHDIDLAWSRAHPNVQPEPLIPDRPIPFRRSAVPAHHFAFEFEREIETIFQMLDDTFEWMW